MKQFLAFALCLILVFSLCACGVEPGETGETPNFTEAPAVTLPDGSTVYSKEPLVEFPQTGEYKETALLTNVPGQGVPLLLDMREDGTIDYIFADVDEKADFQNFASGGAAYYTIAPDGTATKQDAEWMEGVDNYMATTLETTQDPDGKWRLLFTAEEGTILILAQYHNVVQTMKETNQSPQGRGNIQYSTLFKIVDGQVTIIPLQWKVEIGSELLDLRSLYLSHIELEDGQISIFKRDVLPHQEERPYENLFTVTYNMDGTVVRARSLYNKKNRLDLDYYWDDTGIFVNSMDYHMDSSIQTSARSSTYAKLPRYSSVSFLKESIFVSNYYKSREDYRDSTYLDGWRYALDFNLYNESSSLYYHSKWRGNMKALAQGSGKDFCCFLDEAGTGVLMRYTHNPEGKIEPEVVTIWSMGYYNEIDDAIDAAINHWNATHASPIFDHVSASSEMHRLNMTKEDYLTRLNLELLNNQGPDVMILDGLDVDDYLEFMAPLNRLNTDGVYESILSRFTVGDALLAVPFRVSPYLLGRAAEDTEEITSLQQFADIVEDNTEILTLMDGSKYYKHLPYKADNYIQVFKLWYPAWADAIWADGQLNKEVFQEFLTQTTRLVDAYELEYGVTEGVFAESYYETYRLSYSPYLQRTDGNIEVTPDRTYPYTLAAPNHVGLYTYWRYANKAEENQKPDPHYLSGIPGPDGTGVMIPTRIAAVRAGGNEEAGMEFIQLLLSREMQLGYAYHYPAQGDGYPVIWEHTETLLERTEDYMNQEYMVLNDYEEVMNSLRAVVIDDFLYEKAFAAAVSCYRTEDRLTPAEATEDLYEATRIYLAEKR